MLYGLDTRGSYSFAEKFKPADLFLVTANSAIPVADTIRGVHEALSAECPPIDYIRTDHYINLRMQEAERLRGLYKAIGRVVIVDQYVASGRTIRRAQEIAETAQLGQVTLQQGRWYNQAQLDEIDINGVTSMHAPFMYETGLLIGEMLLANSSTYNTNVLRT